MAKKPRPSFGGLGGLGGALEPIAGDDLLLMAAMNQGPQMRSYEPSWRERIGNAIYDTFGSLGGLGGIPNRMRNEAMIAVDFVPLVGDAIGAEETGRALGTGDYRDAALLGTATALGLAPIFGDLAGKSLKSLASRSASIYNPPIQKLRSFDADYPDGGLADAAGNLLQDIDGRPLSAQYVVGRQVQGGGDRSLPAEALVEIAARSAGASIEAVAPSALRGDSGQLVRTIDRRSGEPEYSILLRRDLSDSQLPRVAAHEVSHLIDEIAGDIPVSGLKNDLRRIYNDLNTAPSDWRMVHQERSGIPIKPKYQMTPETFGYAKGEKSDRELMAEALRAYMADPNYLKTVAPKTAARIREFVNRNPRLSKIIQFNAIPAALGGGFIAEEMARQMQEQGVDGR